MWHHAGLSDRFWIHTVKVKVHTYNITPIKRAGYKTPTELFRGVKPNISHLQVFGCQAWVHILKKRQTKLEAKSWEVIFVSYELGSKGYQFWDAANWHFKISCDVKFVESQFLVKGKSLAQPGSASLNDHQFSKKSTQGESDDNLGLVTLDQPPQGPTSPGPPAPVAQPPQPLILPLSPPGESILTLPDMGTAPTPWYSLRPWDKSGHVIKTLETDKDNSLGHMMIHMFWIHSERQWPLQRQKNGKRYQKRNSGASLIWVSGNWSQDQNIARWSNACGHVLKSDGQYKVWLVAKGYTQVQGIDYEETFSLVARYKSIWYLLGHMALLDWEIEAMDVKLAYLHGVLEEEIYMELLKQNKVRYIPTWNWTFRLGIVSDHCTVHTCANDIILTADW